MNDERLVSSDFMSNHKIVYKSDGATKKGCFERCAKYAIWCVREKFAPEYIYKEKKDGNESSTKRRQNLQALKFDPMINLRKNQKINKSVDRATDSQNEQENENVIVEGSPIPSKKTLLESETEYKVKEMIVQTLKSFFLATPGSCISTVDEFKNVSSF